MNLDDDEREELARETVECWRCGEERYTYESCMSCGGSCKPSTIRKQLAGDDVVETKRCPVCGDRFEPDPTGRADRTELNLGKVAGYCGLACLLEDEGIERIEDDGEPVRTDGGRPTGDDCPECGETMEVGAWGLPEESITWQECDDCRIGWGPFTGYVDLDSNPGGMPP